jgi:hypothetical protein
VAPIAVSHSQYILADMLGVLFLTWLLGLWAPGGSATTAQAVGAGVLVGLAAASKFHFAIWIVPAVAAVWLSTRRRDADDRKTAITRVAYCLLASAGVVLFFVPWLWSNPVLMLKEFQGVVLSKVAGSETIGPARALWNLVSISDNFGLVVNAGLLPGLVLFGMRQGGRSTPVYVGLALGALAIAFTSRLYSRYALLVLPAVALIAAIGIVAVIDRARGHARVVVACALLVLIAVSGWQLWTSQAYVGKADSYARAYAWLMRNMKPGDRIAVDAEFPQHLPRTREQLTAMVSEVSNPDAYAKKMASNGFQGAVDSQPMRLAVLNDEFYVAYWAQRELAGDTSRGFEITLYADAPQYNSILTREAVAQFVDGLTDSEKGFDLLLLNRPIELPVKPDVVFTGNPGRTISAYVRKPLLSDAARR